MPTNIQWPQFNRFLVILLARSCLVLHDCLRNNFSVRHIVSRNLNSVLCAWKDVHYNTSPCQFLHYLDSTFRRYGSGKVQFRTVKWHNLISTRVAGAYYRKTSYCDTCMPVLCCSEWTWVCDCKLSVTFLPGDRPGHMYMTLWVIALYTGCLLPRRTRDWHMLSLVCLEGHVFLILVCNLCTCWLLVAQKNTWL